MHVFVRPASALDSSAIGAIHAATMAASLQAALGCDLPEPVAASIDEAAFQRSWLRAISSPPAPDYAVLAAIQDGVVAGFACVVPTQALRLPAEAEGARTAEITALEVAPQVQRAGHGSRLLAAVVDHCREHSVDRIQTWILSDDNARTSFFLGAGFAPNGLRRGLDIGGKTAEHHCWNATI